MSTINHQKLRELAFALQRMATPQKLLAFRAMLSPSAALALLDELEHARTTAPAIRLTLHHEIADFCATWRCQANRKRRKQYSKSCCNVLTRFLIFSEPVRNQSMHTQKNRLPCRNQSGYISAAPHKTGAGFRSLLTTQAHNRASGFFVRTVLPRFFASELWRGVRGRLRSGRVLV